MFTLSIMIHFSNIFSHWCSHVSLQKIIILCIEMQTQEELWRAATVGHHQFLWCLHTQPNLRFPPALRRFEPSMLMLTYQADDSLYFGSLLAWYCSGWSLLSQQHRRIHSWCRSAFQEGLRFQTGFSHAPPMEGWMERWVVGRLWQMNLQACQICWDCEM